MKMAIFQAVVILLAFLAMPVQAEKKMGFLKMPQFYITGDCSGNIDPESRLWAVWAEKGGSMRPFETDGSYMQVWAFDACMNHSTLSYSVKIVVNTSACESDSADNQLQLEFYSHDTMCSTSPHVTDLTLDTCVQYPLGSVKLTSELSKEDLCVATDYVSKLSSGGVLTQMWSNQICKGSPTSSAENMGQKPCATEPDCSGCCKDYTDACVMSVNYTFTKAACRKVNNAWEYGTKILSYTDIGCSKKADSLWGSTLIKVGTCYALNDFTSAMVTFTPPMSTEVQCQFIEMALRNGIDPSFVTWSELDSASTVYNSLTTALAMLVMMLVVAL